MSEFAVVPVTVGGRVADSSVFFHMTDPGKELEIDYRLWLLRSGPQVMVVDTGPPLDESHQRGITRIQDLGEVLRPHGLDASDVDVVLLTHLHWDHAANAAKFPNATFFAQKQEIEFFNNPLRQHQTFDRYYSHQDYLAGLIAEGRIKPYDGDTVIDKGIEAIRVGGHTPGSQMLIVDTADGKAVLSGDAIPMNRNFTEDIPSGIVIDVRESLAALARIRAMKPVALYTGHDPEACLKLG